jgi:uncharacterized protein (TIGR02145 family)
LTTSAVTNITGTSATSGGIITSEGSATVIARGVCWSTGNAPKIADSKTTDGTGDGSYTSSITGLNVASAYNVRAYATNSAGTGYGMAMSFTTSITGLTGTINDNDGNTYKTIGIGYQMWMAENLKTTKYMNGDIIGTTTPVTLNISNESTPKYQWAYDGDENNVVTYGRLYTWFAVSDSRNVCPIGWHVPNDAEWATLITYLGEDIGGAGGKLKETGTAHWITPNTGATNESGFTALPSGRRSSMGPYDEIGEYSGWWSSTEYSREDVIGWGVDNVTSLYSRGKFYKWNGFSVRCLKDNLSGK